MQFLQVDTDIINELFAGEDGKKQYNPFKLNRAKNAIDVLLITDHITGVSAQAAYFFYNGEAEKALEHFKYHLNSENTPLGLLHNYVSLASSYGDFLSIKQAMELYLDSFDQPEKQVVNSIITWSLVYLDIDLLLKINSHTNETENTLKLIEQHAQNLKNAGISINSYRKVLFLAHLSYNEDWFGSLVINFDSYDDEVILRFGVKNALPADVRTMTDRLNDSILLNEDSNLTEETLNLTTYFYVERNSIGVA